MTRHFLEQIVVLLVVIAVFVLLAYALRRSQGRAIAGSIDFDKVPADEVSPGDRVVLRAYIRERLNGLCCDDDCKFCQDRASL